MSSTWSLFAPANFASPLAHKGRSFIARGTLGFISKREGRPFETGTRILQGLQLVSPYTWPLAERDRFGVGGTGIDPATCAAPCWSATPATAGYGRSSTRTGSDGTVRVPTANMNCVRIRAQFPAHREQVGHGVTYELEPSSGSTAFGVMDGHTHGSITLAPVDGESPGTGLRSTRDRTLLAHVVDGLSVTDDGLGEWGDRLAAANARLLPRTVTRDGRKHGFQNTVVRMQDRYGARVDDYLLEFYEKDDDTGRIAELFHNSAIRSVHKYSGDASDRSVYVDCTRLRRTIDQVGGC